MGEEVKFFKKCGNCNHGWLTRDDFLADPEVEVVGYQANFVALEKGLFLFNHSCQKTLCLEVQVFADLYDGPLFTDRKTGSADCAGYCLHRNLLRPCPAKCECAYVREILQLLRPPGAPKT